MKAPFTAKELFKARLKAIYEDQLPGGVGDDKTPEDFDPKVLEKGAEHEMEHTYDPELAQEIAIDHLTEDPDYYEKVEKLEKSESQANASLDFFLRTLRQTVGNKRYLDDIDKLFERMELSPQELDALERLARDLKQSSNDDGGSRGRYWKGGF